jgi:heme/copper-type cytochrome/quinol oxidase subunit 2
MLDLMKWGFYGYSILLAFSTMLVGGIFAAMIFGFSHYGKEHGGAPSEAELSLVFGVMFTFIMLFMMVQVALLYFAGRFVGERTHHTYVFIVAILCMLNFPLGTALGVFTVIWLTKDPIKRRFGVA